MKKTIVFLAVLFLCSLFVLGEQIEVDEDIKLKINGTGTNQTPMLFLENSALGLDYDTDLDSNKETNIELRFERNVSCQYQDDFELLHDKMDVDFSSMKTEINNMSTEMDNLNGELTYYDKYLKCTSDLSIAEEYKKNNEDAKTELEECKSQKEQLSQDKTELQGTIKDRDLTIEKLDSENEDLKGKNKLFIFGALAIIGGLVIWLWKPIKAKFGANKDTELGEEEYDMDEVEME